MRQLSWKGPQHIVVLHQRGSQRTMFRVAVLTPLRGLVILGQLEL